jgi:hypothetical protein
MSYHEFERRCRLTNLCPHLYRVMAVAVWLSLPVVARSQDQQPALKHGVYVHEPFQCKDAPNASILYWDGVGFSGAHSSRCLSTVLRNNEGRYQINTSCSTPGDGGSNSTSATFVDSFVLTRLSNIRFVISRETQPLGTYRWCSAEETKYAKEKP